MITPVPQSQPMDTALRQDAPHVSAAFINALAEEGTKDEAVQWLQKTWNDNCALRAHIRMQDSIGASLKARIEELESNERAYEAILGQRTYNEVAEHIAEIESALRFYADPFAWKKQNDPADVIRVPDFYSETSFGDTALAALQSSTPAVTG